MKRVLREGKGSAPHRHAQSVLGARPGMQTARGEESARPGRERMHGRLEGRALPTLGRAAQLLSTVSTAFSLSRLGRVGFYF
jgi:hypothetical protein